MTTTTKLDARIKGTYFGARGCSCSCNPCDCNPCKCGDGRTPNLPQWRVSGSAVAMGAVGEIDVSGLILLSLAQPTQDEKAPQWEEVILVDDKATPEQIRVLLEIFEQEINSFPAEVSPLPKQRRAVYRTPIEYDVSTEQPTLRVRFAQDEITLIREGVSSSQTPLREWSYDGPMALRGSIDLHS